MRGVQYAKGVDGSFHNSGEGDQGAWGVAHDGQTRDDVVSALPRPVYVLWQRGRFQSWPINERESGQLAYLGRNHA